MSAFLGATKVRELRSSREGTDCGDCGFIVRNLLDPQIRALARGNGADNSLPIGVLVYGLTGSQLGVLTVADQPPSDFSTWQPTGGISSLPAVSLATTSFRVRFTSLAARGTWQVDDLFVDPWGMRG